MLCCWLDYYWFFISLPVYTEKLYGRLALGKISIVGLERVLPICSLALASKQGNCKIMQDELVGAGYDKCLQVLGEITRSPVMLAETKEAFLLACSG